MLYQVQHQKVLCVHQVTRFLGRKEGKVLTHLQCKAGFVQACDALPVNCMLDLARCARAGGTHVRCPTDVT